MRLTDELKYKAIKLHTEGYGILRISDALGIPHQTISDFILRKSHKDFWTNFDEKLSLGSIEFQGPKILTLDIEISPVLASVWRIFKENISIDQIESDWYVLSWAAKWYHEDEVYYEDKSETWSDENDFDLLQNVWKLMDEADIIITQNGKRFDEKKLNTRFILHGMKPPSRYKHIDTLEVAKKHFGFTSNKLEYMTNKLCKQYKKLKHQNFPGFLLWAECLKGNPDAWQEMQEYNVHDTLALEELYTIVRPWIKNHPNINLYYSDNQIRCSGCGSLNFEHNGYAYTNLSKFDKFQCQDCGAEVRGRINLLSKSKRETLRGNIL